MGYIGIYGGLLLALAGWYFGRRSAAKKNGLDEVLAFILTKSRAISWYFTIAAIYFLLSMEIFGLAIGTIPALSILLFVHLGSWASCTFLLHVQMTRDPEAKISRKMQMILCVGIGGAILILFMIVSVLTSNMHFLLAAIPPVLITTIIMLSVKQKTEDNNK